MRYQGFIIVEDKTVENIYYIKTEDGSRPFTETGVEMSIMSMQAENITEVLVYIDKNYLKRV